MSPSHPYSGRMLSGNQSKAPACEAGALVQKRAIPTIAVGPFSDVQAWTFSELGVLTLARPVRANPARAAGASSRHVCLRYTLEIILTLTAYERAICASVAPLPRRDRASLVRGRAQYHRKHDRNPASGLNTAAQTAMAPSLASHDEPYGGNQRNWDYAPRHRVAANRRPGPLSTIAVR